MVRNGGKINTNDLFKQKKAFLFIENYTHFSAEFKKKHLFFKSQRMRKNICTQIMLNEDCSLTLYRFTTMKKFSKWRLESQQL